MLVCSCVILFECVCALFVMYCVMLCGRFLFCDMFRCACVRLCVRMLLNIMYVRFVGSCVMLSGVCVFVVCVCV